MYIDDLTDAVVECAKSKGWKVEAGIIYKKQTAEFEFGKFTPAGRDFSFSAEMKCANINSLIENIEEYYEDFDVDYETYIWLDQFGHGRNGAPYRVRAVLEDMEATEKMIEELLEAIKRNGGAGGVLKRNHIYRKPRRILSDSVGLRCGINEKMYLLQLD